MQTEEEGEYVFPAHVFAFECFAEFVGFNFMPPETISGNKRNMNGETWKCQSWRAATINLFL